MNTGITGWRGFIGSYLKDKIEKPILFQGDLRNLKDVMGFTSGCDRIYHIAGKNREKEGGILANNIIATGNLVLALKLQGINPEVVFISSKQVEWNPYSEYGFAKTIEEKIVQEAKRWCIFRVPNVYGAGARPFYNSVVATFAYQISLGQEVTINNSSDTREFIPVEKLINYLLKPQFSRYVPVYGELLSIGEVYTYLTTKLGEHRDLKKCLDFYKEREI
ncbi:hypothetical protein LCGC14_0341010 [marine sediment metagenome]|uniref:NAD-dependent epimerase/dehydratase domain-containing protein n=1 Tax=marine sediment metagenome TaxID=412755 RepID=A0A0F9TJ86_9ZZZZ